VSTKGGAQALATLLAGLSGMGNVQIGVPLNTGTRVSAFVVAGGQVVTRKTTGTTTVDARYNCTLAYRVDDTETTAETNLMDLLDAFINAINADLTLGGACKGAEIDLTLSDTPQYFIRAGQEYREYPVLVTLRQYGAFTPAP
jgi:hypothetical protein